MSNNYPIIKKLGTSPSAADVNTNIGSFSNILSSSDLNVQLALDSIDDMSFTDISDTIATYNSGRVLFESSNGVTDSANFTYNSSGDILTIGNLQFDLNPTHVHSEGSLHWNDDYKALQMDTEAADIQVVLGQQQVVRVNNQTGSTISKGSVVYINGAQGQRPTIALADADIESQADSTIGIVLADISDNLNGYVATSGLARELDTSAFSVGDHVFLSQTPGQITNVKPSPPVHAIFLGIVTVSNATTGTIELNIDIGEDLKDCHDVSFGTLADGDVVTYNSTSGLWENQQPSGGASAETIARIDLLENMLAINTLRDSVDAGWTILDMIDGIADEYEDQTGVASSGLAYAASGDYYSSEASATQAPASFEETDVPSSTSSQTYFVKLSDLGLSGSVSVSEIKYFIGSGNSSNLTVNFLTAVPNGSNWDLTHVGSTSVTGNDGDRVTFTLSTPATLNASTDMVGISSVGSSNWHRWASGGINLYYTSTVYTSNTTNQGLTAFSNTPSVHVGLASNATSGDIVSTSTTADSEPSYLRAVLLHQPLETVTLNTDFILNVSRDGGTTYTQATLTKDADFDSNVEVLTTGDIDVSSQPSGTSIKYKITFANDKQQRVHGTWLQWR